MNALSDSVTTTFLNACATNDFSRQGLGAREQCRTTMSRGGGLCDFAWIGRVGKDGKIDIKNKQTKKNRKGYFGRGRTFRAGPDFRIRLRRRLNGARRIRNAIGIADVPEAATEPSKRKRNKKKTLNNMYVERGGPLEALESTTPGRGVMVGGEAPGK